MAFDQLAHLHHQKGTTPGFGPHPQRGMRPAWSNPSVGSDSKAEVEDSGCPFPGGATLHALIKVSYPPARGRACASVHPLRPALIPHRA